MSEKYFITLDLSTDAGKCMVFNADGKIVSSSHRRWRYSIPPDMPFCREFNPDEFWKLVCESVREALRKSHILTENILGISSTSMSHGCVFLDKDGKELYAGPNLDARGILYQDFVEAAGKDRVYETTGQWPPITYAPARLQWFRMEKPDVFSKIAHALQVNDWVVYRLTGKCFTEPSIASNTMLLDLRKRTWSREMLELLGFDENMLPEIRSPGEHVGDLTEKAARGLGLRKGMMVALGGRDTQMGMLGSGVVETHDVGIVSGVTTPVVLVTPEPLIDPKKRILTNCHVLPDKWVLESNSGMTGMVYDWLKDAMCKLEVVSAQRKKTDPYRLMDKLASQVPPGSNDSFAVLGPFIMNVQEIAIVRPGILVFPQPTLSEMPFTRKHLIRATLENICYAIKGNFLQLEEVSGVSFSRAKATGGMARSRVWLEILANVLGVPVEVAEVKEGSSLGCAVCAMVGAGMYRDLKEGSRVLVRVKQIIEPDEEAVGIYKDCYERWRNVYDLAPRFFDMG